ncbi:MAG: hypothetical protein GF349_00015 [Candidatus Magasanikbacteria bacterium]|nr:hypothetical protein [Candidatus Magasanikbacteria bacterium]
MPNKNTKDVNQKKPKAVQSSDDLEILIKKNIKWSQIIYEQNKKITKRMTWMVIGNYLRLLIIVVPIVLGIIYLPPLIDQMLQSYTEILGVGGGDVGGYQDIFKQLSE